MKPTLPIPLLREDEMDRFWSRVDKTGPCWLWLGAKSWGYGVINVRRLGRMLRTHRVAYAALVGNPPSGLDLDHLCRNRACCNPAHLEPVPRRVNLLRGDTLVARKARQTHCIHGHELTGENVFIKHQGTRGCLTCRRARDKGRRRNGPKRTQEHA